MIKHSIITQRKLLTDQDMFMLKKNILNEDHKTTQRIKIALQRWMVIIISIIVYFFSFIIIIIITSFFDY